MNATCSGRLVGRRAACLCTVRSDEAAVGGFAEDLPVLMFVLAGVCMLVVSAVNATQDAQGVPGPELEHRAELFAEGILDVACVADIPTVSGLRSLNISDCLQPLAGDCTGSFVTVRSVYPTADTLLSWGSLPTERPDAAGCCSRLADALDDDGTVVVVEVTVIVW